MDEQDCYILLGLQSLLDLLEQLLVLIKIHNLHDLPVPILQLLDGLIPPFHFFWSLVILPANHKYLLDRFQPVPMLSIFENIVGQIVKKIYRIGLFLLGPLFVFDVYVQRSCRPPVIILIVDHVIVVLLLLYFGVFGRIVTLPAQQEIAHRKHN